MFSQLFVLENFRHPITKFRARNDEINPGFIYWKEILRHNKCDEFVTLVQSRTQNERLCDVSRHNFTLSRIVDRKYGRLSVAMTLLFVGFLAIGIQFVIKACA